jgi:predicted RecA/RadA family phage recombinase
MKNYVQKGENLTLTAPRALLSGEGFLVGAIFAVASAAAASGAPVVGVTEEVFDLPKAAGAVTAGVKAYWDNTAFVVTTSASGTVLIGAFTQAAASADATGRVKLTGQIAA